MCDYGWQSIETAPKDGTKFLCYRDGDIANAWWTGDVLGGRGWSYAAWAYPTHWMPLPKTPEEQTKVKHKHNTIVRHIFVCGACGENWEQLFDVDRDWEVRCPTCKSTAPVTDVGA